MSFIDVKYARLVGSRLDRFKEKKSTLYNFRCPYCGDSQKQKSKARGYFFEKGSDLIYKCHNCGVGRTLGNFLKDQARDLYDQYVMERYRDGLTGKGTRVAEPSFSNVTTTKPIFKTGNNLPSIASLNKEHPARSYLEGRKIPSDKLNKIYYADKFKRYVNTHKQTFESLQNDRPRIILPLINGDGKWFGFQGRSLSPKSTMRYITIILDESKPKLYGLDSVNYDEPIFIVEGPFDSLFLDNSIAMAGSDVNIRSLGWSNYIWVYDNEPRNRQIIDRLDKSIDRGDKVVIWPKSMKEKDINDMFLKGYNVQQLVDSNIYQGLQAKIKLTDWKKV